MFADFLQYGFLLRALAAGIAVACVAPVVGMFLVTRRYAFMADTLAHVSFAGIAAGMLLLTMAIGLLTSRDVYKETPMAAIREA